MAQGCIVIADITGYTAYLSGVELEHARDSLHSILDLLVEHTTAPLVVSRLEGDAVISYALAGTFMRGETIVEIVEATYVAFRRAREEMVLNTTCDCAACANLPRLDLKFVVHDGEFVTETIGSHVELVGADVNLVHRLAKNSIESSLGVRAYAAYTEAAAAALSMHEFVEKLPRHTETYEHLGEVTVFVEDLTQVWEREREASRRFVAPDDAIAVAETRFPVPQVQAWDYVVSPEFRGVMGGARGSLEHRNGEGRLGPGAVYQCVHGRRPALHTVVDWRPFDEYTFEGPGIVPGTRQLATVTLEPDGDETRVRTLLGPNRGPMFLRLASDAITRRFAATVMERHGEGALRIVREREQREQREEREEAAGAGA